MVKKLLALTLLVILSSTSLSVGQEAPPASNQAVDIENLVNRAADLLEQQGSKAFGDFRKKGSPWRYGDVYVFVIDMRGVIMFNAARPELEGRNMLNEPDADGKAFRKDFIQVVSKFGSGWVDYMYPKPGQSTPTVKWSYVSATRVDGVEALVGAGVYVD